MDANKLAPDYCFRDNRDFLQILRGSNLILIRRSADSTALRDCIEEPEKYLSKSEVLKDSRSTKAGTAVLSGGKRVFIKRYNNKGLRYTLRYMFRSAKPFRTWRAAWHFEMNGIPTPRPLAASASRTARILKSAYLVAESIHGIIPTLEFCSGMFDDRKLQLSYAESIARLFAKMHKAGVYHGDAKLSNIYVSRNAKGVYSYGLWDLDGVDIRSRPICGNLRASELARTISSYVEIGGRLGRKIDLDDTIGIFVDSYADASGMKFPPGLIRKKAGKYLVTGNW